MYDTTSDIYMLVPYCIVPAGPMHSVEGTGYEILNACWAKDSIIYAIDGWEAHLVLMWECMLHLSVDYDGVWYTCVHWSA